jgi:hypothetical protein
MMQEKTKKIKMGRLKKPEAEYYLDKGHFAIDCSCRGKNGEYSGSRFKNPNREIGNMQYTYQANSRPSRAEQKKHTFYMRSFYLEIILQCAIDAGEKGIIIVCDDCGREFPLDSFKDLKEEIFKDD